MFPPEGEEELEVRPIDGARGLGPGVGRSNAADDGGDGRPVGGKRRELLNACVLDLLDAPRGCPGGTDRHDEVDAVPEVVYVGAAELRVGGEGRQGVSPLVTEGAEVRLPGDGVRERLAGSASNGGGEASASPRSKCAPSARESRVWWLKAAAVVRSRRLAISPRLQESWSLTRAL